MRIRSVLPLAIVIALSSCNFGTPAPSEPEAPIVARNSFWALEHNDQSTATSVPVVVDDEAFSFFLSFTGENNVSCLSEATADTESFSASTAPITDWMMLDGILFAVESDGVEREVSFAIPELTANGDVLALSGDYVTRTDELKAIFNAETLKNGSLSDLMALDAELHIRALSDASTGEDLTSEDEGAHEVATENPAEGDEEPDLPVIVNGREPFSFTVKDGSVTLVLDPYAAGLGSSFIDSWQTVFLDTENVDASVLEGLSGALSFDPVSLNDDGFGAAVYLVLRDADNSVEYVGVSLRTV